jgi:hypothetical protein
VQKEHRRPAAARVADEDLAASGEVDDPARRRLTRWSGRRRARDAAPPAPASGKEGAQQQRPDRRDLRGLAGRRLGLGRRQG